MLRRDQVLRALLDGYDPFQIQEWVTVDDLTEAIDEIVAVVEARDDEDGAEWNSRDRTLIGLGISFGTALGRVIEREQRGEE